MYASIARLLHLLLLETACTWHQMLGQSGVYSLVTSLRQLIMQRQRHSTSHTVAPGTCASAPTTPCCCADQTKCSMQSRARPCAAWAPGPQVAPPWLAARPEAASTQPENASGCGGQTLHSTAQEKHAVLRDNSGRSSACISHKKTRKSPAALASRVGRRMPAH